MTVISPVTYSPKVCHNHSFFVNFRILFCAFNFLEIKFCFLIKDVTFYIIPYANLSCIQIRFLDSCIYALLSKYPFVKFHFIDYLFDRSISFYKRGKNRCLSYPKFKLYLTVQACFFFFFRTRRCFFHERMQ